MYFEGKDMTSKHLNYEEADADYMLEYSTTAANHKQSPTVAQTSNGKKTRGGKNETSNTYKERPWHYKFSYGYPIMGNKLDSQVEYHRNLPQSKYYWSLVSRQKKPKS